MTHYAIKRPDGTLVLESVADTNAEAWRRAVKYCQVKRAGEGNSGYTCVPVIVSEVGQEPEPVAWMLKTGHGDDVRLGPDNPMPDLDWPMGSGIPAWKPLYLAPPSNIRQQERERCAKVCEEHARRDFPWASENSDIYHAQADGAKRCGAAIRALTDEDQKG